MKLLTLRVPAQGIAPAICAHRPRYDSRRNARQALRQARPADGHVYACPLCGGFHVGGAS